MYHCLFYALFLLLKPLGGAGRWGGLKGGGGFWPTKQKKQQNPTSGTAPPFVRRDPQPSENSLTPLPLRRPPVALPSFATVRHTEPALVPACSCTCDAPSTLSPPHPSASLHLRVCFCVCFHQTVPSFSETRCLEKHIIKSPFVNAFFPTL